MEESVWITSLPFRRRKWRKIKKKQCWTWLPFSVKKKKDEFYGRRRDTSSPDVKVRDIRVLCFERDDYSLLNLDNFVYIYAKLIAAVDKKTRDNISLLLTTVSDTNCNDIYFNFNIFITVYGQIIFVTKK